MKALNFKISEELHRKFKTYCSLKGISMKDAIPLMMEIVLHNDDIEAKREYLSHNKEIIK